jgi:nucleoside phosphorylase
LHFKPDAQPLRVSERMRARLDLWRVDRKWLDEISEKWPLAQQRTRIEMHVGPLGSGAAVIDAEQPVLDVIEHWRKLIGVEMEAYGVHLACHSAASPSPEFLCIKSICDFATKKTDDWQDYAAFTAAELCHRFLTEEWENLITDSQ